MMHRKIFVSALLLAAMMWAVLPGAETLQAAASSTPSYAAQPNEVRTTSGLLFTVDRKAHPPGKAVRVSSRATGPAVALLQTVPAVPGVTFQIAGQQYVTGADGTVAVMVPQAGTYDLQVITDTFHDPYRRVEFSRWLSETFEPTRQIHLPANDVVQVGLNVYELVGQRFVGPDGKPVAAERIKQFSIRSLQGDAFTFHDGSPRWIPASRVTRRRTGGLQEVPLLYTVSEVLVDGSNVVNKAQQQFYAQPNGVWTISLLLYSLHVTARDALFGFPVGKELRLQLPDGRIQSYPLAEDGTAEIHSLARGNYYFQILGASGLATTAPIALSKDQEVYSRVVTYLDMEVVGAAGVLVAVGLFLFGRLSLRRKHRDASRVRILET